MFDPTLPPPPEERIGYWPWVGFLTLAISLALLAVVGAAAWIIMWRRHAASTDEERLETRALLAEAERESSQFSRI